MEINPLLMENRSLGFVGLDTRNIPAHILARLLELRSAKAAGKSAPAPSRQYTAAAEQRNLTLPRGQRSPFSFAQAVERHRAAFRNVPKGMSLEAHLDAVELRDFRALAQKQAAVIAATSPKQMSAEEQRQIKSVVDSIFPVRF